MGWISVKDDTPDIEPHRNIFIGYTDAAGRVFTGQCSSYLISSVNHYCWMEIPELPEPPEQDNG